MWSGESVKGEIVVRRKLVIVALLMGMVVAACGGGDDDAGTPQAQNEARPNLDAEIRIAAPEDQWQENGPAGKS